MNLAEPSGSSPPEKPPGSTTIWAGLYGAGEALHDCGPHHRGSGCGSPRSPASAPASLQRPGGVVFAVGAGEYGDQGAGMGHLHRRGDDAALVVREGLHPLGLLGGLVEGRPPPAHPRSVPAAGRWRPDHRRPGRYRRHRWSHRWGCTVGCRAARSARPRWRRDKADTTRSALSAASKPMPLPKDIFITASARPFSTAQAAFTLPARARPFSSSQLARIMPPGRPRQRDTQGGLPP